MVPALRWHYTRGTRGLLGNGRDFAPRLLEGDLYTVARDGTIAAALFFDLWGDYADVHIVRWGEIGREQLLQACQRIAQRVFAVHSLGTIRAELPVSNVGARRLAEDCGMQQVGRIERGIRLPGGGFSDTCLYILTPDGLKNG